MTNYTPSSTDSYNWEDHPDAAIFGMLEGKEYEQFKDGIKEVGAIFDPVDIIKGPRGNYLLADGRNRRRVAQELGFPLKINTLPDDIDVKLHVISKNLHRRHLKPEQLAYFAANMVEVRRGNFHGNQFTRGIGNVADTIDTGREVSRKSTTIPEAAMGPQRTGRLLGAYSREVGNSSYASSCLVHEDTAR